MQQFSDFCGGGGLKSNQFITGHYSNSKNLRNKYKSINKKGKQTGDAGYAAAFSASITSRPWGVITCSSLFIKHSVWFFVIHFSCAVFRYSYLVFVMERRLCTLICAMFFGCLIK